jgi:hypothetical protein
VTPRLLYESLAPFGPVWSALAAGFAAVGPWGQLYLTDAGEKYLRERGGT